MQRGLRKTETKAVNRAPSPGAGTAAATVIVALGDSAALIQREPATALAKIRITAPTMNIGKPKRCVIQPPSPGSEACGSASLSQRTPHWQSLGPYTAHPVLRCRLTSHCS